MTALRMWVGLDLRRRWRSLAVLALLVALTAGTIMTAVAGARRGNTAIERLSRNTRPATIAILANTPGFDWSKVRAMSQVEALSTFVVDYTYTVTGIPGDAGGFPAGDADVMRTVERPVVLAGRVFDPARADEVVVTPQFVRSHHKGVGDTVVIHLPTPQELASVEPGPNGLTLHGPVITARIVGVVRSAWYSDTPASSGSLQLSPGLTAKYPGSILGDQKPGDFSYVNALVRLRGGEGAIPAFREAFNRLTGRSDIDIWDVASQLRDIQRAITFEARCLLAFALVALVAACFLVGQAIVRFAAGSVAELQTLRALGMTPRQAVVTAAVGPALAGLAGGVLGVAAAVIASRWFPLGTASGFEASPGFSVDWPVLAGGAVLALLLVTVTAAGAAAAALGSVRRRSGTRRSAVATLAARAGLGVPVLVGTRFALEPGRGKTAVPVRPAVIGAVTGVVGVIAVFTFAHGVSDATTHPERFGQTFQLDSFIGINGQDFGPVRQVLQAVAAHPDVAGVDDGRTAVATSGSGQTSISLWEDSGGTKPLPIVINSGRRARAGDEVVLAPRTLSTLGKRVGDTVELAGSKGTHTFTIVGAGLVPEGPHNGYADGGWLTTKGFDSAFNGYKYRVELVAVRPGRDPAAVGAALRKSVLAAVPQAKGVSFEKPDPLNEIAVLKQVQSLPIALGVFLALLAIAAVGHALATAVRRRSYDIAVLRALGLTRWQSGGVVVVQASVLAVTGLLFGIPIGLALGRSVWRVITNYVPLQYVSPLAIWALLLIGPVALLLANALAAWPGRRAALLRVAHVLRAE